jgi:hypothetical protein
MRRREFLAGLGGARRVAEFIRQRLREPTPRPWQRSKWRAIEYLE